MRNTSSSATSTPPSKRATTMSMTVASYNTQEHAFYREMGHVPLACRGGRGLGEGRRALARDDVDQSARDVDHLADGSAVELLLDLRALGGQAAGVVFRDVSGHVDAVPNLAVHLDHQ